jgi:hypothetical protein
MSVDHTISPGADGRCGMVSMHQLSMSVPGTLARIMTWSVTEFDLEQHGVDRRDALAGRIGGREAGVRLAQDRMIDGVEQHVGRGELGYCEVVAEAADRRPYPQGGHSRTPPSSSTSSELRPANTATSARRVPSSTAAALGTPFSISARRSAAYSR